MNKSCKTTTEFVSFQITYIFLSNIGAILRNVLQYFRKHRIQKYKDASDVMLIWFEKTACGWPHLERQLFRGSFFI